ncbi:hypothetical protein [Kitasatospora sp. NPDC087315]|uniref:hypothetical protein n=1 Tax=Kitasatospora sp. NPDC087315 TaxID=3364069 RepID=UPI00380B5BB7
MVHPTLPKHRVCTPATEPAEKEADILPADKVFLPEHMGGDPGGPCIGFEYPEDGGWQSGGCSTPSVPVWQSAEDLPALGEEVAE